MVAAPLPLVLRPECRGVDRTSALTFLKISLTWLILIVKSCFVLLIQKFRLNFGGQLDMGCKAIQKLFLVVFTSQSAAHLPCIGIQCLARGRGVYHVWIPFWFFIRHRA